MLPFWACYFFLTLLKIWSHFLQGKGEHGFTSYVALTPFFNGEFDSGYISEQILKEEMVHIRAYEYCANSRHLDFFFFAY